MGRLIVHRNGMMAIEKEILLNDKLSYAARGMYAYLVAKLDTQNSIESISDVCVDEASKATFDELINNDIIIITETNGQIDYAVR